ncbi:MAG TPA: glycosyltransferase [Tepidisphaeraceae bacterium]|nr:glycosyltransferase [Tepidisphaeraceae bacterium]
MHPATQSSSQLDVRPQGVAVTIGVGPFADLARLAAREVRARTGLDTIVLGEKELTASGLTDPTSLKFRLFDYVSADNLLYFDADMVCLDTWDPSRYFGCAEIVAVRERMVDSVLNEAAQWNVPPEDYFNSGLLICNRRAHRRWLAEAESLRHALPTAFRDQSPLNAARCRLNIPLKLLDRRFNWLGFGSSSLSHDLPAIFAHKLVPGRIDLNAKFFEGQYELLSPRVTLDPIEAERLEGREFVLTGTPIGPRKLQFRSDGTILPFTDPDGAGYWFVRTENARPVLALASETQICHEFIETLGGEWVSTRGDGLKLRDPRAAARPLDETNARSVADQFLASLPPFPQGRFQGRGIVICGGGPKYLPGAWVCIHMLRRVGCRLPIELWHLNAAEVPSQVRSALEPLGVHCVNAAEVRRRHPVRFLGGWELKPYAILHSRFEQVLYLDADNVPVQDPTILFDTREFADTGAVFWPDYGRLAPDRSIWRVCQVSYVNEPEFESGQLLIDKHRCWPPLNLTLHMNEHGDFYYRHIHGDKETFHLAWRMTNHSYAMVPHPIEPLVATMCQHDFQGRRLFQHRNMDKWKLNGANKRVEGFWCEEECRQILAGLAPLWK